METEIAKPRNGAQPELEGHTTGGSQGQDFVERCPKEIDRILRHAYV